MEQGLQLPTIASGAETYSAAYRSSCAATAVMEVMDLCTQRIVDFGVASANIDSVSVCRMFNHAIVDQALPKYLSTDHDPLFKFHQWLANLRVIEIEQTKSVP